MIVSTATGYGKKMAPTKRSTERYEEKLTMIKHIKVQDENLNPNLKKEEQFSSSSNTSNKKRKTIDETTANNQIPSVVQLMEPWVQLHDAATKDLDWLNPKKKTKRLPEAYDSSCSMSTCWPPRALYLPHVYVIPF